MTREDIDRLWNESYVNGMLPFEQREKFAVLVTAAEREACAKVCDELSTRTFGPAGAASMDCAAAIRARGDS